MVGFFVFFLKKELMEILTKCWCLVGDSNSVILPQMGRTFEINVKVPQDKLPKIFFDLMDIFGLIDLWYSREYIYFPTPPLHRSMILMSKDIVTKTFKMEILTKTFQITSQ